MLDKINSKGGNNVNKHLAYMALANSATDQWNDFDIDRCIVVDDFEYLCTCNGKPVYRHRQGASRYQKENA